MPTATTTIVAIDILLEPDARMLKRAEANNARLLKAFPNGFALDVAHRPHITLLQCFVPAEDLNKVYAAVGKVFESANVPAMNLEGFKYYYAPAPGGTGVAGVCARPTPALLRLQADVIAAATPFTVKTATIDAFTAAHDNPATDAAMIAYVGEFVRKYSGEHFNPHVSTGVGSRGYLDKMLAEPFEPFTFSPAGAAVYQLGPFGTAARKLQGFDLKK
jgi:2'-5' RNA ligase superfamily protein